MRVISPPISVIVRFQPDRIDTTTGLRPDGTDATRLDGLPRTRRVGLGALGGRIDGGKRHESRALADHLRAEYQHADGPEAADRRGRGHRRQGGIRRHRAVGPRAGGARKRQGNRSRTWGNGSPIRGSRSRVPSASSSGASTTRAVARRPSKRRRGAWTLVARIGGKRIAAPATGATDVSGLDLNRMAERYRAVLEIGDAMGVVPEVEVWGFSKTLTTLADGRLCRDRQRPPQGVHPAGRLPPL